MTDDLPDPPTMPSLRFWFDAVLRIPSAERQTWLDLNCPDSGMRATVRELLVAHASDAEPWSGSIGEWFMAVDDEMPPEDARPDDLVGRTIADYRLLKQIGSGGMATVFLAERQHADFDQRVAIKILRHTVLSASELRMFRSERQLLAALDHPNIARLIDGGVTTEGLPYLVLEYIDGLPITDYCRQWLAPLRQRVRLACDVCRAVEHAHRALIVHRDIKPANVLVTTDGVVKLLDFGVAKLINPEHRGAQTVDAFMTPDYAAPEQLQKTGDSPAMDVFALGVVLHELLLGIRPQGEPARRPSELATQQTDGDPSTLRRFLAGDLDNILQRALQPDPLLRYRNAGELADDLQRFLDGEPVLAHPPSTWYRTKKFVLRHRGAVGVTLTLVVAVLASLSIAAWQGIEARHQATRAETARLLAEQEASRANSVLRYVLGVFTSAQEVAPERERLSPTQLLDAAEQSLQRGTDMPPLTQAKTWAALAAISDSLSRFDRANDQYRRGLALLDGQSGVDVDRARAEIVIGLALTRMHADASAEAFDLLAAHIDPTRLADAEVRYQYQRTLAEVELELGHADQALAAARAAAAASSDAFGEHSRERLIGELLPARTRSALGRHAEAIPLLEQGLARWRALGLPDELEVVNIKTGIAVGKFQTGDPETALRLLDEAIQDARAIHDGPSVTEVRLLENAASMRFSRGDTEPALVQLGQAIDAARRIYPERSAALISLELTAATMASRQDPESAVSRFRQVIALCAEHANGAALGDCGRAHGNFANLLIRLGRLDEAHRELDLADAHQRHLFGANSMEVGSIAMSRGNLLLRQDALDEALASYDVAMHNYAGASVQDQRLGRLLFGRAKALYGLKRWPEAERNIDEARDNFGRYLTGDVGTRAETEAWRALIAHAQGHADAAITAKAAALAIDPKVESRLDPALQSTFTRIRTH